MLTIFFFLSFTALARAETITIYPSQDYTVQYIEKDYNRIIEVLDYNATWIRLNVHPKGFSILPNSEPLSILDNSMKAIKTENLNFNLFNQEEIREYDSEDGYSLGKMIKFGENSTTIKLNPNSTNKAYYYVGNGETGIDYGACSGCVEFSSGNYTNTQVSDNAYAIKMYITIEQSIVQHNFQFDLDDYGISVDDVESMNVTWEGKRDAGTLSGTSYECWLKNDTGNFSFASIGTTDSTNYKNISSDFSSWFDNGNVLYFKCFTEGLDSPPYIGDIGILTDLAQVDITYTEGPPPEDSCTWSGTGTWLINYMDNCTLANTNMNGNAIIFYGTCGYVYVNGIISNVTNKTYGTNHCPLIYATGKGFT
jgi:hypothetical protein